MPQLPGLPQLGQLPTSLPALPGFPQLPTIQQLFNMPLPTVNGMIDPSILASFQNMIQALMALVN